jgi:hypothetical protein
MERSPGVDVVGTFGGTGACGCCDHPLGETTRREQSVATKDWTRIDLPWAYTVKQDPEFPFLAAKSSW